MSDTGTVPSALPGVIVKLLGGLQRSGRFALQVRTIFVSVIGGIDLDLTQATVPPEGARLIKVSLIGGVHMKTSPDVRVKVGGFSLLGGRNLDGAAETTPTAPVLEVSAWGLIGGVRLSR